MGVVSLLKMILRSKDAVNHVGARYQSPSLFSTAQQLDSTCTRQINMNWHHISTHCQTPVTETVTFTANFLS